MRGPRHGRPADQEVSPRDVKLKTLPVLTDLVRLVLRSRADGLVWRLSTAIGLTLFGAVAGVLAPLLLGKAMNALARARAPRYR